MSTMPRAQMEVSATCLGPVQKLNAPLSKHAQNLIYARNGTGKSFLTRAFRYLDMHGQGEDISDAAFNLISEESPDNGGRFALVQGTTHIGSLTLSQTPSKVTANTYDRIFHVFSDDFVHSELRRRDYDMDGDIESEIQLDQADIDTKEVEDRLDSKKKQLLTERARFSNLLDKQKTEQLVEKASISRRLKEFTAIIPDEISALSEQPKLPERSFKSVLADLDALKSMPAEPEYPGRVAAIEVAAERLRQIHSNLEKFTSPSTVSEEIKKAITSHSDFFESGLEILKDASEANCPFCQQSVAHPPAKDRIEGYMAYFADAEGRHKKELRAAWTDIKAWRALVRERLTAATREMAKFESLRKVVPSQRAVELPDLSGTSDALDSALASYLSAIQAKGESPGSKVEVPEVDLVALLAELNERVILLNGLFDGITAAVKASDNERKALQRSACQAFQTEFAHSNWSTIEGLRRLDRDLDDIQQELKELKKSQLSASVRERVAQTFESLISSFFGNKYTFDRKAFVLKRENRAMARGASRTLSDGEKTAIAFCYFIACAHRKVRRMSDYEKLFLVFDDPITSMSYDFVFAIAQTLKNMSISASGEISVNPADIPKGRRPDLLVFTHSSYFYNTCITNAVVKSDGAFFLHQVGDVHMLSKRDRYIAPFEQHLKHVVDVHDGGDPDHTTGNAVRCVLEAIGRFCHPDKCDSLSNFVTFLAEDGGFAIKSVLINNLSHGTYYDEMPSPDELREACSEAILIVERYAGGQLALVRALTPRTTVSNAAATAS